MIDDELSGHLVKMAEFRNRLVHLYWEVEHQMVYRFVQEDLDDFKRFEKAVVAFLRDSKGSGSPWPRRVQS